MNLSKNVKIAVVAALVAAANNTDQKSAVLDMSGWDGVLFVTPIDDSVATGVATLQVQQNDENTSVGAANLVGAVASAVCAVNDDLNAKALIVDVYKPMQRYVLANVKSATANIAFGGTIAIQYRGSKLPADQAASILAQVLAISPDEA